MGFFPEPMVGADEAGAFLVLMAREMVFDVSRKLQLVAQNAPFMPLRATEKL